MTLSEFFMYISQIHLIFCTFISLNWNSFQQFWNELDYKSEIDLHDLNLTWTFLNSNCSFWNSLRSRWKWPGKGVVIACKLDLLQVSLSLSYRSTIVYITWRSTERRSEKERLVNFGKSRFKTEPKMQDLV
jgi:hypothetical protein